MSQVWIFLCFLTAGLAWRNPTNSPAFHLATVAWGSSTQLCQPTAVIPEAMGSGQQLTDWRQVPCVPFWEIYKRADPLGRDT